MIYQLQDRKPSFKGQDYFIADNATLIGSVTIYNNVSIWFNAVLRGDNDEIIIHENSNIQDGSVLHTDPGIKLVVGKNVTVGHQAMLHGCTIKDNSLIGIHSTILNNAVIGKNCIIGANALIPEGKVIPDNSIVLGSPGKIVKSISMEQKEFLQKSANTYIKNFKRYKKELIFLKNISN